MGVMALDLDDTERTYRSRTTAELKRAHKLFASFDRTSASRRAWLRFRTNAARLALRHNVPFTDQLIRRFGFDQFFGGETIPDVQRTLDRLSGENIRAILDYAVEGVGSELAMDSATEELVKVIKWTARTPAASYAVFKVSSVAREELLARLSALLQKMPVAAVAKASTLALTEPLQAELKRAQARIRRLCDAAHASSVRILIDAEQSWIQPAIDWFALEMMRGFNAKTPIVYTTVQLYRLDRLAYLREVHAYASNQGFTLGVKLVRGAYLEHERQRAQRLGYPSPVHATRSQTDDAFDAAVEHCLMQLDEIAFMAATHNELSIQKMVAAIDKRGISPSDPRIEVAQLLGMRDNISVCLASRGYNVSKYVPFGPVREAFPYLTRRSQENQSLRGQMSREMLLIESELRRRARTKH